MPSMNMGNGFRQSALAVSLSFAVTISAVWSQDWEVSEFAQWCDAVCQQPDESWRTIPWQTDLLAAQRLAVADSKPLFIWAMDGHPLGCT